MFFSGAQGGWPGRTTPCLVWYPHRGIHAGSLYVPPGCAGCRPNTLHTFVSIFRVYAMLLVFRALYSVFLARSTCDLHWYLWQFFSGAWGVYRLHCSLRGLRAVGFVSAAMADIGVCWRYHSSLFSTRASRSGLRQLVQHGGIGMWWRSSSSSSPFSTRASRSGLRQSVQHGY